MDSLKEKRRKERKAKLKKTIVGTTLALTLSCGTITFASASENEFSQFMGEHTRKLIAKMSSDLSIQMDTFKAQKLEEVKQAVQTSFTTMQANITAFATSEQERYEREVAEYAAQQKKEIEASFKEEEEKKKQEIKAETDQKIADAKAEIDANNKKQDNGNHNGHDDGKGNDK